MVSRHEGSPKTDFCQDAIQPDKLGYGRWVSWGRDRPCPQARKSCGDPGRPVGKWLISLFFTRFPDCFTKKLLRLPSGHRNCISKTAADWVAKHPHRSQGVTGLLRAIGTPYCGNKINPKTRMQRIKYVIYCGLENWALVKSITVLRG